MKSLFATCFLALWLCVAVDNNHVLGHSDSDGTNFPYALDVFQSFNEVAAIYDSNNDSLLECLNAERNDLDLDARTAVYTWNINSPDDNIREDVTFHAHAENAPGVFTYYTNYDPTTKKGVYLWSNEDCVTVKVEFDGNQCMLWVQRDLKDSVPQRCIEQFTADCSKSVPLYSRDLCYDGEGDY